MDTLYTLGIGLYEGNHDARRKLFKQRIRRLANKLDRKLLIVDIRREKAGSRNGRWCAQGDEMAKTLQMPRIRYVPMPDLCRPLRYGTSQAELKRFKKWVEATTHKTQPRHKTGQAIGMVETLLGTSGWQTAVVLMCSCGLPYKPNGKSINCHRVIITKVIKYRTECRINHLIGDFNEPPNS